MRQFKHLLALIICFFWTLSAIPCHAEEASTDFTLYATAAVLMDADSGRVLYEKNGNDVMAMASTTKIMTCILTLEHANLDEEVEISSYAASMPKVKLYVQKGEHYILRDLLHSLMLESHNDSAAAIAEHIGKSYLSSELKEKKTADYTTEESKQAIAAFAKMMNEKAQEIGCENSWFITPNGLDATETITLNSGETIVKEHTTTASDLALIMSYCIKKSPAREEFLNITRTPSYSFSANNRSYSCNNHNAFLNMMDGALSGKTGFTNKAGYCYVGALERDGKTLVVALLACGWPNHKTYKWSDTRELMEYGLEHYTYHTFSEAAYDETSLPPIPVLEGQTAKLNQTAYTTVEIAGRGEETEHTDMDTVTDTVSKDSLEGLLLREDEQIEVVCQMEDCLLAPIERGTQVGTITYSVNGEIYKTETIITGENVDKIDYKWCWHQIWNRFLPF